jgi:hypothetical protein
MYHVVNKPRLYIIRLHPKESSSCRRLSLLHTVTAGGARALATRWWRWRGGACVRVCHRTCCTRAVITEHASSQTRREISVKSG